MKKKQFFSTAMSAACLICIPLVPSVIFAETINSSNPLTFSALGTTTYDENVTIEDSDAITVDDGYLLTMVANGVETEIEDGTYTAPVEFVVTPLFAESKSDSNNFASQQSSDATDYEWRTALYVDSTGIVDDNSVVEAIASGTWDATSATGLDIESTSDNFNGIMVVGDGTLGDTYYEVSDSTFNFISESDGSDVSDFTGKGAVLAAYNGANLKIDNCTINTEGVARLAAFSDGGSNVLIEDSSYNVAGGTLYDDYVNTMNTDVMVAPPWVLGITGNARGTNLMGTQSSMTFVRVDGKANQWGVVSTDSGTNMELVMVDMNMTLTGDNDNDDDGVPDDPFSTHYGSGYGTYIIGSAQEYFYGVHINVGTYASIMTGGDAYYKSSNFSGLDGGALTVYPITGAATYSTTPVWENIKGEGRNTVIHSDAFGFMAHNSGSLTLTENTELYTDNAAFLYKSGDLDITVEDKTKIEVADGVLLQMIDNDDSEVGANMATMGFNTEFMEAEGYPGIDYTPGADYALGGATVTFTAEDVALTGNLYNGTGYYGTSVQDDGTYSDNQGGDALQVTLKNKASLRGAIASTSYIHVDEDGNQNTYFTIDEYYYLGHVANEANYNGYNDISVTLEDGSSWVVTGESLIQSLTVEKGACLQGNVTVDGEKMSLKELVAAGTVTGEIALTPLPKMCPPRVPYENMGKPSAKDPQKNGFSPNYGNPTARMNLPGQGMAQQTNKPTVGNTSVDNVSKRRTSANDIKNIKAR